MFGSIGILILSKIHAIGLYPVPLNTNLHVLKFSVLQMAFANIITPRSQSGREYVSPKQQSGLSGEHRIMKCFHSKLLILLLCLSTKLLAIISLIYWKCLKLMFHKQFINRLLTICFIINWNQSKTQNICNRVAMIADWFHYSKYI